MTQLAITTGTTFTMWREFTGTAYARKLRAGWDNFEDLMSFKGVYESQGWLVGVFNDQTGDKLYGTPED